MISNAGELPRVSRASWEESKFDTIRKAIAAPKIDNTIQENLEVSSILSANSETIALEVVPSDRKAIQRADWKRLESS